MPPLKITCLIDSLGSGGAQRQLCTLATMLKKRGAVVSVLTYHKDDFFKGMLKESGVEHHCLSGKSILSRVYEIRKILRSGNQDVVLAFLPGPCVYAELAALPARKWGLVVSERSAVIGSHLARFPWKRALHRIADYVCTNSHTNRLMIEHSVPKLIGRVLTIYNVIDLKKFCPPSQPKETGEPLKMIVAASHQRNKNLAGLIEALLLIRSGGFCRHFEVHWYGDVPEDRTSFEECEKAIQIHDLGTYIKLFPASKTIADLYKQSDVLGLFSFYEGLPNVVCEAMASGLPILMSNVCDAESLVRDYSNGFVFDPHSPEEIASAIVKFCKLSLQQKQNMGLKSRELAERLFSPEKLVGKYFELLESAAKRSKEFPGHWIPEVPDSAYRTVGELD